MPSLPAAIEQAPVLEQARQLLDVAPRLAFEKAALLRDPILRERLRRDAFLAMSRVQPKDAAAVLRQVIHAPWLAAVHFAQALDVVAFTVRDQPELSKQFLLVSAARHAPAALRELRQYIDLPYGPAIRDAARNAAAAPAPDLRLLQIRQNPASAPLPAAELLRLASFARTEDERETAIALLRQMSWEPETFAQADPLTLRAALALLADTGTPLPVPAAVVRLALRNIEDAEDPLAEAVKAASILAAAPPGVEDALPPTPLGRLLRALRTAPPESSLPTAELFPNQLCLQRHIFHNDDDGLESFDSFLHSYAADPNWILERTESLVHLTGRGPNGRRIEIYANIPIDLQLPANFPLAAAVRARQDAVTRALPAQPAVIVHRGHDHHFDETRKYLRGEARLVFLGSCRGMANVEDVVTRCRRAQMIATRGIGATAVNDTFLRALNRKLLDGGERVDWEEFWASLRPALGASEHFQAYVPPHKNEAARFLAAWYRQALSAP